jgi:predicted membrane protein
METEIWESAMSCKDNSISSAVLSGGALIGFGVLLLLSQMGIIHDWFNFWATVFIFVGFINIFQSQRSRPWGILLMAAGVLIELRQLGYLQVRVETYWPVLIIAAGSVMVWRALQPVEASNGGVQSPHLNVVAIWGGGEYRIRSKDFRGGDLVAFMGGFDIDLRDADIAGDQAVINVTAFMGGGVLRVPETWSVSMQVGAFMGGHSLKTREGPQTNKTLVVKGVAIMGGVEVRN